MVAPRCGARAKIEPTKLTDEEGEAATPSGPSESKPGDTTIRQETRQKLLSTLISDANKIRMEGNESFKNREYDHAVDSYSEAIHVLQEVGCFWIVSVVALSGKCCRLAEEFVLTVC